MADVAPKTKVNRPTNSKFKQQKLPAWKPILTPRTVLPTFFGFGVFFLALGIALYVASQGVKEQQWDYTYCSNIASSDACADLLNNRSSGYTNTSQLDRRCRCEVVVDLNEGFGSENTYLYYGLTDFYQNHRRYVKSRWDPQLRSEMVKGGVDCDPLTKTDAGVPLMPCGLVANSLFNDTIKMYKCLNTNCSSRQSVALSGYHISWASDRENKYKNPTSNDLLCSYGPWQPGVGARPPNWPVDVCQLGLNTSTYNPWAPEFGSSGRGYENEDLIVWMRTAALPDFRKLYRYVQDPLPDGRYVFAVDYNYPVASFNGRKKLILSTTSWIGGENPFLGICYIVVACLCIAVVVFFVVMQKVIPRRMADDKYLKWDRD